MVDAPSLFKIPKSDCPDIWIRLPRHKWPKIMVQYGRLSRSSWAESVRSSCGRTFIIWENPVAARLGESFQIGNANSLNEKKDCSCQCLWTIWKLAGKKQNMVPMWKVVYLWQTENAYSYTVKKGYSYLCMWTTQFAGRKQNIDPMWNVLNKEVDFGEPTSFLDHVYLGCTQRGCETSTDIVDNKRNTGCFAA